MSRCGIRRTSGGLSLRQVLIIGGLLLLLVLSTGIGSTRRSLVERDKLIFNQKNFKSLFVDFKGESEDRRFLLECNDPPMNAAGSEGLFVGMGALPTACRVEETTAFGSRAGGQPVELKENLGTTAMLSAVILASFGRTAVLTAAMWVSHARQAIPLRVMTRPANPSFSLIMIRISPSSLADGVQKRGTTVWSFLAGDLSRKSLNMTGSILLDFSKAFR